VTRPVFLYQSKLEFLGSTVRFPSFHIDQSSFGLVAAGLVTAPFQGIAAAAESSIGAATGNRAINLPAESALSFTLTHPLGLKPGLAD
jgi:hypothetical protein